MEVRILYFEDCPNVGLAEQRVRDLAAGDPEIRVARQRVADPADAAAAGLHGSPTILIDGVDVMRRRSEVPTGDACRLDLPTPQDIREALLRAQAS